MRLERKDNPGMAKLVTAVFLLALTLPFAMAQATDPLLDRAKRLLKESPVIDGHNDYPWAVREKAAGDLDKLDLRKPQPTLMTDFARLAAGGVGGQFWSVYVPVELKGADAVSATLEQIDIVHRMAAKYPEKLALALTA